MVDEDKVIERKILLKRAFQKPQLFEIGRNLAIPYFELFENPWVIDEDQAAYEIASIIGDSQLKEIFETHKPKSWVVFRGEHYTFEDGLLSLKGSWNTLRSSLQELRKRHGDKVDKILKVILETSGGCNPLEIAEKLKGQVDPAPLLADMERMKLIVPFYEGDGYKEWTVLEEVSPLLRLELGLAKPEKAAKPSEVTKVVGEEEVDYVAMERQEIERMDNELNTYLTELLKKRLNATIKFGKKFSISVLADYLIKLFGPVLYFDSLLSITQQYGLADVEIIHEKGGTGMRTG
ncbi:hypothetical protein H5T51_03005, partial [Candidatus Bathyarchaeota archaeon]|nr:hypothetical protein [Candidatus Bathyarchaeota archaeon]